MDERAWLTEYFEGVHRGLLQEGVLEQCVELQRLLKATHGTGKKTIFAGNGGSAAIASHCAVDFTKSAGIRCVNFNEADLITCLANDYGYEHWLEKALEFYADPGDCTILISSSGKSKNMLNAAHAAGARGLTVVTFTGFSNTNPLRGLGRLNFWVESRQYNVVEMTHQLWLLAVCDLIANQGAGPVPARKSAVAAVT